MAVFRRDVMAIDELIDNKLQPGIEYSDTDGIIKLEAALDMEINIHETFAAIEGYVLKSGSELLEKIADSESDFIRYEKQYRGTHLSKSETKWLDLINDNFLEAVTAGSEIIVLTDQLHEKLAKFEADLLELDHILDDDVQLLIHLQAVRAKDDAQYSSSLAVIYLPAMCVLVSVLVNFLGVLVTRRIFHDITLRERAKEAIHYQNIVSNSHDMLALLDKNFVYLAVNEKYVKAFGKTSDEIVGCSVSKILGDIIFETKFRPNAEKCLLGEEVSYESWLELPNTGKRYMEVNYSPYRGSDNEIKGLVVNVRDITVRKRAEEIVLDKQKQLDDLLANVDAIVLEGSPGKIDFVGGRVKKILGYPVEDWFKHQDGPFGFWIKCLHPDDTEVINICKVALERCEDHSFEYRMIAADGRIVWFYDTVTVESKNGNPTKIRYNMIDITARKKAEKEMQERRARLRLVKDVAMEITSDMSIEEVVTNALEGIFNMFPDYRVSYGVRIDENLYRFMASVGPSRLKNIKGTDFDIANAPEFVEALTKGYVVTNDILQDKMVAPLCSRLKELQVRAMINTPVVHAARLIGVLWLDSDVPRTWSDHEITTLEDVSRYLAVAVKNAQLIEERKKASEELKAESAELIEKNIALNQVLEHLEKDKQNYKEQISESMESLLMPIVKKLKKRGGILSPKDISLFENSLDAIVGKEIDVFRKNLVKLSPRELDICELIREGKSSKEISSFLNLSTLTVHKHRESIRSKLQLKNKSTNLSAYLRTREFLTDSTQSLRN